MEATTVAQSENKSRKESAMDRIELLEFLADLPGDLTVAQMLGPFGLGMHWHGGCNHCGKPIVNFGGDHGYEDGKPWFHSTGSRGCRAASVDGKPIEVTWDQSLHPTWKATPGGQWDEQTYADCHVCALLRGSASTVAPEGCVVR
jgi:hypothetical protein